MVSSTVPPLSLGTHYRIECIRDGKIAWVEESNNMVVYEGLRVALGCTFTPEVNPEWHMGICTGVTVHRDDTATNHQFVEYLGTTNDYRPWCEFVDSGVQDEKYTYTASNVQVMISEPALLKGVFLTTHNKKGEDEGMLYGVAPFTGNKDVVSGDALQVTITVSAKG